MLIICGLGFCAEGVEGIDQGLGDYLGRAAFEVAAFEHADELAVF